MGIKRDAASRRRCLHADTPREVRCAIRGDPEVYGVDGSGYQDHVIRGKSTPRERDSPSRFKLRQTNAVSSDRSVQEAPRAAGVRVTQNRSGTSGSTKAKVRTTS